MMMDEDGIQQIPARPNRQDAQSSPLIRSEFLVSSTDIVSANVLIRSEILLECAPIYSIKKPKSDETCIRFNAAGEQMFILLEIGSSTTPQSHMLTSNGRHWGNGVSPRITS